MNLLINNNDQIEMIVDYSNLTIRQRINEEYSLSFSLFKTERNKHCYDLVQEERIIEYDNQFFRIKRIDERSRGNGAIKNVDAQHIFFDLIDIYKYETLGGNYTIHDLLSFALSDTNYTFEVHNIDSQKLVFNFGQNNVLTLVQQALELWEVEIELQGKHIVVKKQIGNKTDFQFRYKYNLKAINKQVDTSNLATYIKGYGKGFTIDYTSPMASIYGIRHAEPIRDDNIADDNTMLERLKRELNDKPDISFSIEFVDLQKAGYDDEKINLGDEIFLVYEPLGIEMTSRIVEYEYYPQEPTSSKVTIANYRQSITDVMSFLASDVQESKKQNEINRSQIRQTDERIRLEVERIDSDLNENRTLIEQTADNILLKAESTNQENGDKLVGLINVSSENVLIQAKNVDLVGQVNFSMLANDVKDELDSKVSGWELGDLAYEDLVEKAKLGTTVIQGGYIRSELLTADNIVTGTLSADRIWGGTLSGVTINVSTDAHIGDVLYLNGNNFGNGIKWGYGWGVPEIYTEPVSRTLFISDDKIKLNGRAEIGAYNGSGDFIGFHVNAIGKRLAVYANGSYVGYIDIN